MAKLSSRKCELGSDWLFSVVVEVSVALVDVCKLLKWEFARSLSNIAWVKSDAITVVRGGAK